MKTLALSNGDLVIGGHGHATVDGVMKAAQDVGVGLRETYGHDRFHPELGAMLQTYIGQPISGETRMLVDSEVKRVVRAYIQRQGRELQKRQSANDRARHEVAEVVVDVDKVQVNYRGLDRMDVIITIRTLGGQRITLRRTVEA